ncbi:MAG: extracellular solute-binding protein [Proteobacteria bacterium]|nr:extracellular solute-binding protein [Pseudomonadota bacterium]HQR04766.1 extracellular solute-binding protein [Rhodocyclaceae bacterium]
MKIRGLLLGLACILVPPGVNAQEILLRHSLEGRALDTLATLTLEFNETQKGKARIVLQGPGSIEDKRHLPQMAFLDPDDRMAFFDTLPRFKPLYQVMSEGRQKFNARTFYPQIAGAVDDASGRIQALPMGMSVPVLFWNKAAFRKAGLDPESPPKTWWEMQARAGSLFDAGVSCPVTTSRFSWVHLENLSTQHNENVLQRPNRLTLNSLVHVKHLALLSSWNKSLYFHYYGPRLEGDTHFLSGECAMLTGESRLYSAILRTPGLDVGIAPLPYYDDVYGATPRNVLPDGASLWILAGLTKAEYQVIAHFVTFLMQPARQREWVKATGYLPMMPAALPALRDAGVPAAVQEAAERRLSAPKSPRAVNGGGLERLRDIVDEEVAAVWRNEIPAKEALDTTVRRAQGIIEPLTKAWR